MSDTQQEVAEQLVETFEMLDSWEDRYGFLIDLARKLPPMNPADKTEENKVRGCQSNVWMVAQVRRQQEDEVIDFVADSDAQIVKGLIAILNKIYSGQPADKILLFDIEGLMNRLGLDQHLSMGRRNGLFSMVQRIKALAATLAPEAALQASHMVGSSTE